MSTTVERPGLAAKLFLIGASIFGGCGRPTDFEGLTLPARDDAAASQEFVPALSTHYNPEDIWYTRKAVLEELARNRTASEDILSDLKVVAREDQDWRIRELAAEMLKSAAAKGDFSSTEPFREKVAADYRLTIGDLESIHYHARDIWYTRLDALEFTARHDPVSDQALSDLWQVASKEDDWRIEQLAREMIASAKSGHGYSDTEPAREQRAEQRRLTLGKLALIGYDSSDIWYDRLEAIESFQKQGKCTIESIRQLQQVAERDDDWRISGLAKEIVAAWRVEQVK